MAEAIRSFDWSATPLGEFSGWPVALKVAVGMMLNSRFPKCIVWGADYTTIHNDAFLPILGAKPSALGRSFRDVWAEAWDAIGPIVEKAYAGEATFIEDFPLVVARGGAPEEAYFTFCYSPIRDENGRVCGMIDTVIETTVTVEAQRDARLLNAELAHRMKNVMALVSAVANQTFRAAESLEQAQQVFGQRISTLSDAHSILTEMDWHGAELVDVVRRALEPHAIEPERISIAGPRVMLSADQTLPLALAVHELATNAVKYGALSNAEGRIALSWSREGDGFRLEWHERGGPPVTPPRRRGFGSRLVEQIVGQKFDGTAKLYYEAAGLRYVVDGVLRAGG